MLSPLNKNSFPQKSQTLLRSFFPKKKLWSFKDTTFTLYTTYKKLHFVITVSFEAGRTSGAVVSFESFVVLPFDYLVTRMSSLSLRSPVISKKKKYLIYLPSIYLTKTLSFLCNIYIAGMSFVLKEFTLVWGLITTHGWVCTITKCCGVSSSVHHIIRTITWYWGCW